jgi:hypothetical protein
MKDLNFKSNQNAGLLEINDDEEGYKKSKQKQMPKHNANLLEFDDPYDI